MVAILRAAPVGGGGGGSGDPNANNHRGSVVGLAPGATDTIVSVSAVGLKLRGFTVLGDNDGVAWVELDGVELPGMAKRMSIVKVAELILPNPEVLVGTTIALKVRNEADLVHGVSASFEGTLLGE